MVKIFILLAFSIILADARKHHLEIRVRIGLFTATKEFSWNCMSKFSHFSSPAE